jgi:hypothetical protein
VFLREVGKMLCLTTEMQERAEHFTTIDKLKINLISNEDIFLFKAMTPRPGDVIDCVTLMD